jgi:hypothetical protein
MLQPPAGDSAQVDPQTLGANLFLLIGVLLIVVIVLILMLGGWVAIKAWIWQARRDRAQHQRQQERLRPDGKPYPPMGRGMCDQCARAFERVYFLPTGRRLCPDCYKVECEGMTSLP